MQEISELVKRSYSFAPKYTEIMAGLPEDYKQIKTLRDLLEINYKIVEAKDQLRQNLISKIQHGFVKIKKDGNKTTFTADKEKLNKIMESDENFSGVVDGLTEPDSFLN